MCLPGTPHYREDEADHTAGRRQEPHRAAGAGQGERETGHAWFYSSEGFSYVVRLPRDALRARVSRSTNTNSTDPVSVRQRQIIPERLFKMIGKLISCGPLTLTLLRIKVQREMSCLLF